jgi:hypothetical protein
MTEYGVGMRYRWSMLAIGAAPLLLWAFGHSEGRATSLSLNQDGSTVGTGSVPVVVELFTSEGCSSCPPADALLARLESQQPIPHTQVIALEEHVDYWNGDGWTDPFSGREWTARQEEYAYTLRNRNPYTPQMVIDGHTELVGNREGAARQAIAVAGTQAKAHVSIAVSPAAKAGSEQAIVSVDPINGTSGGDKSEIWLAVTESGLHSAVKDGENAGSDLHHASVVRTLRKIGSIDDNKSSSYSGATPLHLDSAWKRQNLRIVVFVQARKSRQIVGAAAAPIEQ